MNGSPLRVGVIGVGLMGADHAERLVHRITGADLVAVSDPDTGRAAALAARYPGVRAVADPLALIADEGVDAVLIASPGGVHEEQVLACVEHGRPTLCEKPLTMDSASSLRVVEAERKAGRPLVQVGFMRRFDPEYAELKRLLDTGDLGRILLVHNVHRNRVVPDSFRSEMIVRDSLVHEVDVCRWLFDDEIETITVLAPKPTGLAAEGVLDPQVAIFQMTGGGMATTEVFVNSQIGYEVRCEAVAERGNVTIGLGQGVFVRQGNRYGGAIPDDFRDRFGRAYDLEVQAWVDATRRGEVTGPTAWDGYAATAVCTAGMESLATGRAVRVDLANRADVLGGGRWAAPAVLETPDRYEGSS
ncbi:Gfo/Idh/MocA family protein [Acrocarpospora catenulata]|uniref:Gfo/Idh/MocA family protein n=1 Tax=Acrocarpospora catenulata TaxID=2836182 RepID=UPI001BD9E6EF|nr:Gfo/Idh/MocA family oxidoreductase [Acrocarpospora catenulata]